MKKLLEGKTIVVTGCASGIGLETARVCKLWGATVLGVDRTMTHEHVDALYKADLSDPKMIASLVQALPPLAQILLMSRLNKIISDFSVFGKLALSTVYKLLPNGSPLKATPLIFFFSSSIM